MIRAIIGQWLIESAVLNTLKENKSRLLKPKEISEKCGLYRDRGGNSFNNLNDAYIFAAINHLIEKDKIIYKKPSKKNAKDGGYKCKN